MSYVRVRPDTLTAAAVDLKSIASTLDVARLAAASHTLEVAPAAADEVSTSIAQLFSAHAVEYQAAAEQAADYQDQFVQKLTASAASYTSAEDLIASLLGTVSPAFRGAWENFVTTAAGSVLGSVMALPEFLRLPLVAFGILATFVAVISVVLAITLIAVVLETFPV